MKLDGNAENRIPIQCKPPLSHLSPTNNVHVEDRQIDAENVSDSNFSDEFASEECDSDESHSEEDSTQQVLTFSML